MAGSDGRRRATALECSGKKRPHSSNGQWLEAGIVERGKAEFIDDHKGRPAAGPK